MTVIGPVDLSPPGWKTENLTLIQAAKLEHWIFSDRELSELIILIESMATSIQTRD